MPGVAPSGKETNCFPLFPLWRATPLPDELVKHLSEFPNPGLSFAVIATPS